MAREITSDFIELESYIKAYELKYSEDFLVLLKLMHKKMYAYLTFLSESEYKNHIDDSSLVYLNECGSDLAQGMICWTHGLYKPANLMLRSSIETYIKGIVAIEDKSILTEKSMYKVFEMAEEASCFKDKLGAKNFQVLRQNYGELCITAHSADLSSLNPITVIKMLPAFDEQVAERYTVQFVRIVESMLAVFLNHFYSFVWKMHHKNLTNFLSTISKQTKREVNDIKSKR